jgi:hypothetical protein
MREPPTTSATSAATLLSTVSPGAISPRPGRWRASHARDDIARPFQQIDRLAAARDRVLRLDEQLRQTATPPRCNGDHWLVAAAMHDAAVMAGISGAAVVASGQVKDSIC